MDDGARERYQFAGWTLDVGAASLTRPDQSPVALTKLSFDLLVVLLRRAPDVVSVDELAAAVWPDVAVSDETVVQRVALLRRALDEDARDPKLVRSVRGRGYQTIPEVERCGVEPTVDSPEPTRSRRRRPGRLAVGVAAASGIAVVALAVAVAMFDRPRDDGTPRPAPSDGVAADPKPALDDWLARAGTYLASQREADNELALELFERALAVAPEHPDALAGASLALSYRTTRYNRPSSEADRAEALARRAITAAPDHAGAHEALAMSLNARGGMESALEAFARAIELAPDRAAPRASAAYLKMVMGRLADALHDHVMLLDATEPPTYLDVQMASNLALLGFEEAAAVWFDRAITLRPESVFAALETARWHLANRRLEAADRVAREAIERSVVRPELVRIRGDIEWLNGDREAARAHYLDARAIDPTALRTRVRLVVLDGDEAGYAETARKVRSDRASGDRWPPAAISEAILHAGFGHDDEALRTLDIAIDQGFRDAEALVVDPVLGALAERRPVPFARRLDRIRQLVAIERQRVLDAAWLPPAWLDAPAANNDGSR